MFDQNLFNEHYPKRQEHKKRVLNVLYAHLAFICQLGSFNNLLMTLSELDLEIIAVEAKILHIKNIDNLKTPPTSSIGVELIYTI